MDGWQEMAVGIVKWLVLGSAVYFGIRFFANKMSPSLEGVAQRIRRFGPAEFTDHAPQTDQPTTPAVTPLPVPTPNPSNSSAADDSGQTIEEGMPVQRPVYAANELVIKEWFDNNVRAEKREEQLIRALSFWQIQHGFERINFAILGSQLSALGRVNVGPVDAETLRAFYDHGAAVAPSIYQNDTFARWLNWLTGHNLIAHQDSIYLITEYGREFLIYLPTMAYPLTRNG